jgi:hypothetical protein
VTERLRLLDWKPLRQGQLRGFATIELPIGLVVRDCPVLHGRDGVWAALPAKPEIDREGRCRSGPGGARLYVPVVEWRSRKLREAFSVRVVSLVKAAYPDDLD